MTISETPRGTHNPDAGKVYDLSLFTPTDMQLNQGLINTVVQYAYPTGELFVLRTARDFSAVIHRLQFEEYPAIGFVGKTRSVRGMSLPEQAEHMNCAVELGLATVSPVVVEKEFLLIPFIPGQDLRTHLQQGDTEAIGPSLQSLNNAHEKDFIFGDRWAGNIVIRDDGKPNHVDFDIKVQGKHAEELELSQLIYSILSHTTQSEEAKRTIGIFVQEHPEYSWKTVHKFLKNYIEYMPPERKKKKFKLKTILLHQGIPAQLA